MPALTLPWPSFLGLFTSMVCLFQSSGVFEIVSRTFFSLAWWPVIPVHRRRRSRIVSLGQENYEFEATLGYIARPYFKTPKTKTKQTR
jgi:hypothetical protein